MACTKMTWPTLPSAPPRFGPASDKQMQADSAATELVHKPCTLRCTENIRCLLETSRACMRY